MKMKFNFGAFKGKKVKFLQHMADLTVSCSGTVKKVKEKSGNYIFNFESGEKLEIVDTVLARMIIRKEDDLITFTYDPNNNLLSGLVGFAMADTYGFPIEITEEILEEDGYKIDIEGFRILRQLQRDLSSGTFKTKDGWTNNS